MWIGGQVWLLYASSRSVTLNAGSASSWPGLSEISITHYYQSDDSTSSDIVYFDLALILGREELEKNKRTNILEWLPVETLARCLQYWSSNQERGKESERNQHIN